MDTKFKFDMGQSVTLESNEKGKVIARAEYEDSEPNYRVRYTAADGRLVECWWSAKALTETKE